MPKKNLPSYRLHKPTGQAICVLRGKMFYLGQHKSKESRAKYNELIAEYLANDCKLPPARLQKEISCEDLILRFMDWAAGYYLDEDGDQTQTVEQCRMALAPLVRFYGGNPVSDFGPLSLKFIRDKMIEEGYTLKREVDGELVECREDYTRETINSRINIIRQAFRWGVENELVTPDISHALDAVANPEPPMSVKRAAPVKEGGTPDMTEPAVKCETTTGPEKVITPVFGEKSPSTRDGRPYDETACNYFWERLDSISERLNEKHRQAAQDQSPSKDLADTVIRLSEQKAVLTLTGRLRAHAGYCARHNTIFQGLAADGAKLAMWKRRLGEGRLRKPGGGRKQLGTQPDYVTALKQGELYI